MRKALAIVLGLFLGGNGLWMIATPFHWFANVPGVTDTGPANAHFIRDVGCAYPVAALALLWLAAVPLKAWPAVLAGGVFLLLHALIHVWDTMAGRAHPHQLLIEVPTIILPALMTLWLGWQHRPPSAKDL